MSNELGPKPARESAAIRESHADSRKNYPLLNTKSRELMRVVRVRTCPAVIFTQERRSLNVGGAR